MSSTAAKGSVLKDGTVLEDRFLILNHINSGSFGDVYRAEQIVFGKRLRLVALKILKLDATESAALYTMFNDAMTLLRIQDEKPDPEIARHLIKVLDIGIVKTPDGNRPFISMEFVRGARTLEHYLMLAKNGGLVVETAVEFIKQILRPLAWMHTLDPGIIHGDLKPDNVLFDNDHLVLTDFGLSALTTTGAHGGAVLYLSPEELAGQLMPGDDRGGGTASDVYSAGLMFYEMLTGHNPFENVGIEANAMGDSVAFQRAQYAARRWPMMPAEPDTELYIPSLSSLNPETDDYPALQDVVRTALAFSVRDRYPNAALFLRDVESKALKTADLSPGEMIAAAESLCARGRFDDALRQLEHPGLAKVTLPVELVRAWILAERSGPDDSVEALRLCQAALNGSASADTYDGVARVYESLGQTAMAANFRSQAIRMRR